MSTAKKRADLSLSEITRLTMLKICGDPDTLAQAMLASAGADAEYDTDGDCCRELLEFCKQEGIDPMPAIKKALEPSPFEKMFRAPYGTTISGGSRIRSPFTYEEQL